MSEGLSMVSSNETTPPSGLTACQTLTRSTRWTR